ncbi:hypothetical protein [Limimaricola hongkongensis]|uniref:EF-hand domain-containing protein n=1 Tax=Limimaricola hongkongensis DSM 17492 TaxID=1122180 RepID=A0A017H9H9_9RHOB|nr:hypothetical protein [Limimaricola hongkongensis]EYD70965.1 hypothetical protein Lokhon_02609 [Limimaricola hongkongensis DSM 17492]
MTLTTKSLTAIALVTGIAATGAQAQEATFGMVDTDTDGYLSEAELTSAFGEVGLTLLRYDLDGDGRLTAEEIEARNDDIVEEEGDVRSNVDEVLENGRVGEGDPDGEDDVEEDEFGGLDRPEGDEEIEDDDSDDEFGELGDNELENDEDEVSDDN